MTGYKPLDDAIAARLAAADAHAAAERASLLSNETLALARAYLRTAENAVWQVVADAMNPKKVDSEPVPPRSGDASPKPAEVEPAVEAPRVEAG